MVLEPGPGPWQKQIAQRRPCVEANIAVDKSILIQGLRAEGIRQAEDSADVASGGDGCPQVQTNCQPVHWLRPQAWQTRYCEPPAVF